MTSVTFFTIATGRYSLMFERQLMGIREHLSNLNWSFIVVTNESRELREFAKAKGLEDHVTIIQGLDFTFPLASMLRFKYMKTIEVTTDFLCYLDCDMEIVDAHALNSRILRSTEVCLAEHPGYFARKGLTLGWREKIFRVSRKLIHGGLGDWETKLRSSARVPRKFRNKYAMAAIFFGPTQKMVELSSECDGWMDLDLRKNFIPRVHDESYLNKWATIHEHEILGPNYCYYHFPWVPSEGIVVRALDKSTLDLRPIR